ncbi:MAG: hypothetical protein NTW59_02675 [Candidatus Diapherotrites archaeon]|nr:hypothetical protein [Candidatus Diapherotrites archaeon]
MNYSGLLSFSFGWLRDRRAVKYLALGWLVGLLFALSLVSLAWFLFGGVLSALWSGDAAVLSFLMLYPEIIDAMVADFIFLSTPVAFFFTSLFYGVRAAAVSFAMKKSGSAVHGFNLDRAVSLPLLFLCCFFCSVFSFFNRKFLLFPAAFFVLVAATFISDEAISIGSGILALVVFFIYCIVILYNALRLSLAPAAFASKGVSIMGALRKSWSLTEARFWRVFAHYFVVGVVSLLAFGAAFFLLSMLLSFVFSLLVSPFSLAFQAAIAVSLFFLFPFAILASAFATAFVFNSLKH